MYDDKELKEYRDLMKPPDKFEEGFDWKTIVGAVFIGFLMMPGSMYLQLVIGQGIGPAHAGSRSSCSQRSRNAHTHTSSSRKFSCSTTWRALRWPHLSKVYCGISI